VTARDGINGLVVWGLGTVLSAVMLTNVLSFAANTAGTAVAGAGQAVGAVTQAAGTALGGVASGVASVAETVIPDAAQNNPTEYLSNQLLRPSEVDRITADPAELAQQTASIVANIYRTGEVSDADRAYLASAVAARTDMTPSQASDRVDQVIQNAQDARQQAADVIETASVEAQKLMDDAQAAALEAARVARNAGILTAFVLAAAALVAGVAAFAGAVRGGRDRDAGRITYSLRYTG
jgi:hypothetical protein